MANYLIFPMECLNVTQTYEGLASHKEHTTGSPKDYPADFGGKDTGRDYFLCPCDEIEIKRIYGVGNGGTNTVWLQSTSKVIFANGTEDFCCMQVTHPNDDDLQKLETGQKFKRGAKIFREGSDGATANHLHISVGKGKIVGNGWTLNSLGKWVLTTTNGTLKPEDAFFIDKNITTEIRKTLSLNFKTLPENGDANATESDNDSDTYETYTVKKGDTLWEIAAEKLGSGTRYNEIVELNNLKSTTIFVGQKLRIPKR